MQQTIHNSPPLDATAHALSTPTVPAGATIQVAPARWPGLFNAVRKTWLKGIPCASEIHFALSISLLWALLYNSRFWELTLQAMWQPSRGSVGFLISLFVLVVSLQSILLLLIPTRTLLRSVTSALFIIAAVSSYFSNTFGAIMNKDMMRNVLQTDPAEIGGLVNSSMLIHVLVFGVLPAVLVWRVSLPRISFAAGLKRRGAFVAATLALCGIGLFACSANYAVFFREHKPIRFTLMPSAPAVSLAGVLRGERRHDPDQPLLNPAGNSQRVGFGHARPLVLFVVVGETARADNFQLGGYARPTNPELKGIDNLVYFNQATSCGTSTAQSVPCIFSHLGRDQFDVDTAGRYANLLDSLEQAGVDVEWRDNNAGCKGVCARVAQIDYSNRPDAELCPQSYCYDAVMLTDLAARLQDIQRDTVIVFHQIGSHGPAYSERYPPQFERFKPACHSNQLHNCTVQEIVNAYDNTIAYTDYILAQQIGLLKAASERVDGALIYASDHGESLGEQGIYLHGMPYSFAPKSQKQVPMLLWTSSAYDARVGMRQGCLQKRSGEAFSHDNLYHTILGAAEVRNRLYDANLDIFAACRRASHASDHE